MPRLLIHMAKDGEVAHSFQPLLGGESLNFLGSHGDQVADPMIEALFAAWPGAESWASAFDATRGVWLHLDDLRQSGLSDTENSALLDVPGIA